MSTQLAKTIAGESLELDLTTVGRSEHRRLTDLATDLLLIVIRMREAEDLGEPEPLRMLIRHYLDLFVKNCRAIGIDGARCDTASYALVALLDETVLSRPGPCRDTWLADPLQLERFGDNLAGEVFYRKLDELLASPQPDRQLLELYYLCLCLGFAGKYLLANPEQREGTIARIAAIIDKTGGERRTVESLSPHAFRTGLSPETGPLRRPRITLFAAAGALLTVVIGWIVSAAVLRSSAESLIGG